LFFLRRRFSPLPALYMELNTEETHYLSPISLGDDSDNALSPVTELEPNPGIDGTPVRCTFIFA